MKDGCSDGNSAHNYRAELPVITILFTFCLFFCAVLPAQETPKTKAPPTEANTTEVAAKPGNTGSVEVNGDEVDVTSRLEEILKQNKKCLMCHSKEKSKLLEDGSELSLQVHKQEYLDSAHGEVKCISCHRDIGNRKHPSKSTNITINNQRDYSVEMNDSCRKCHMKKFKEYKGSVHAALIAQGSTKAPLCTDCHSAHAVETMEAYKPENGFPCKKCHENIFEAYSESVHGQARINGNTIRDSHIQAPICADCHQAHEVTALAIGDVLRTTCIACHENVMLLHNQWLPNAGTHLDIVSCAVCHAPFAKRKFDLHLYDNVAKAPVAEKEGEVSIQQQLQAIAAEGAIGDPLEIWKARGGLDGLGETVDISLRSRMEVMSGVAAHQIADKSFAVRTCDSCHEPGWREKQNVTVSMTQPDGRRLSIDADREVLGSVEAVNSISDFYKLGGNKSRFLDILLLLSLAAGIAIPVGHFTLGKMIKEYMQRGDN